MTVCLFVAGVIASYCSAPALPPPDTICRWNWEHDILVCSIEDITELPIRASWYYPPWGGTNCVEPCDEIGNGMKVKDAYNWVAACEGSLYKQWFEIPGHGRWRCYDNGGFVAIKYGRVYTQNGWWTGWFITKDFLMDEEPYWNHWVFHDWNILYSIGANKNDRTTSNKHKIESSGHTTNTNYDGPAHRNRVSSSAR